MRSELLARALAAHRGLQLVQTRPARPGVHVDHLVAGHSGTVFKRARSCYTAASGSHWRLLRADRTETVTVLGVALDRERGIVARCRRADGQVIEAAGFAGAEQLITEPLAVSYSRVDADGDLRHAQLLRPLLTAQSESK